MELRDIILYIGLTICFLTETQSQRWCRANNGNRGECISVYDCPAILRLLQRPRLTPDIVSDLRNMKCSNSPDEVEFVCCEQTGPEETHPNQIYTPSNNQGNVIDFCGIEGATRRILGGTEATLSEFPWMALLEYERDNGSWTYECGGFLINSRYVITAAHCVRGRSVEKVGRLINIRIGEYNTETNPDCVSDGIERICNDPVQNLAVEEIIPHENYVPDNLSNNQNDIALIRMSGNVKFSEFVSPICLPTPDFAGTPVGKDVTISGWGQTLEQTRSSVKTKVNIPVVSFERCQREYNGRTSLSSELQLCAGGNYIQDACFRDSGGPLISRQNGAWIAEGIVSFGIGCGLEISSVYTKVSAFVPWIHRNMRP
ncbi:CLIP domain-containing serine protease B9-like isoform X2 [Lutzomyia longipalpis]|nr:CLIP domain-containing serine protease B9-like isoform X2 [Lutzomyia longipalpis]